MEDGDTDIESGNDSYSYKNQSVVGMGLLSTFGWTPNLLWYIQNAQWIKAILFFFLFLLDLCDAVFDLILSVKKMHYKSEGGVAFGIFLFITTVMGRVISGLYGYSEAKGHGNRRAAFVRFAIMEIAVFFIEDGAAVLVLANSTGRFDLIETMSMYLTIASGLCYMIYFILGWVRIFRSEGMDCNRIQRSYFITGSVVFQVYFLITQVVLREEDDGPFSGGLEMAAFAVYIVNVVFWGGLALVSFYYRP